MKNILLQHWTGELDELCLASKDNIEKYSAKCSAEYRLLRGNIFRSELAPPCQKLYMLDEEFDDYDLVVMVDMDMFVVNRLDENIFTDVTGIGLFQDYQKELFSKFCNHKRYRALADPTGPFWGGAIWRLDRSTRQSLRKFIDDSEMRIFNGNYNDEGIMHRLASLANVAHEIIPDKWCWGSYLPNLKEAAMIHVRHKFNQAGPFVPKIEVYNYLKKQGIIE